MPVAEPDLRDRAVERCAVEVLEVGGSADQQFVRAGPEQQARAAQAADRGRVFRLASAFPIRSAAEHVGLIARDRGHARQEVVDHRQLIVRVPPHLRGALLAESGHRRLDRGHLFRDELDDDPPAIRGVGDSPDVTGLLESIDHPRDGTGCEAHQLGQPAGRRGAGVEQHLEGLDVRLGQAEADRHRLPEERALEIDPAQ